MLLRELPASEKPRERLIEKGGPALSDVELLAVLLRVGTRRAGVLELSQSLISKHSLKGLLNKSFEELIRIPGLGKTKACQLLACRQLCHRINTRRAAPSPRVNTPMDAASLCPELCDKEEEHLVALFLNSRHRLIKKQELSVGNINTNIVDAREVYKHALRSNAYGIILMHNHPSGDPEPSDEDIEITRHIAEAGTMLNIQLIDHIVIGKGRVVSLKERGGL